MTGKISPSSRKHGVEGAAKPEAIRGSPGLGTLAFSIPWESSPFSLGFCSSPLGPLAEALNFNIFCCSLQSIPGEWVPGWVPGPWRRTQGAWGTVGVWLWLWVPACNPRAGEGLPRCRTLAGRCCSSQLPRTSMAAAALLQTHCTALLSWTDVPASSPHWQGVTRRHQPPHQSSQQGQPGQCLQHGQPTGNAACSPACSHVTSGRWAPILLPSPATPHAPREQPPTLTAHQLHPLSLPMPPALAKRPVYIGNQ